MLYKSLATLSFLGLASAFHGTGYEVKPYSDLDCLDYWGEQRCAKMAGKGFCVSDDECPSDKTFRCSKTRKFCAGTCRTCPAKCAVPDAVEGVYGGAFPAPGSGGNLEFPFFLVFEEGYGTLYMYGDKSGWDMSAPESPEQFGCALFVDSGEFSVIAGGNATGTTAPFCATFTASAMQVDSIDYGAYWALASSAMGGSFFNGVQGSIDLSGGYGTASANWTDGQNIDPSGETVQVAAMALDVVAGGAAPYYAQSAEGDLNTTATKSVAPSFGFFEGKVCYTAPPLWNGMYPDAFAAYAGSIGASLCLDKITDAPPSPPPPPSPSSPPPDYCQCNGNGNQMSCDVSGDRYCGTGQECYATTKVLYGEWDSMCAADVCECTGNGNQMSCSASGDRYCGTGEECYAKTKVPYGQWDGICQTTG